MQQVSPPRRRGRPPKTQPSFSESRDALIRAGLVALTEKGFSATGLDQILKAAGVPKGSFYYYFDSKEAFGSELITRYGEFFAAKLARFFTDPSRSPVENLMAFVIDAEASMARFDFSRGCLVGNLGQEIGALPEAFRQQLGDVFLGWQHQTAACLKAAQAAGEIGSHHDADRLAAFFWIGWEGAVLRAKLERSGSALRTFAGTFFSMIRT